MLTEDLTVEAGDSFELDVSLDFRNGGPSGVKQKVTVLQLFKGAGTADQIYFCDLNPDTNPSRTCVSGGGGVTVTQNPVMWYNISLELAMADSGEHTYTAQYNLIDPRNSGQLMITKVFTVTVDSVTSKCAISILISYLGFVAVYYPCLPLWKAGVINCIFASATVRSTTAVISLQMKQTSNYI